MIKRSDEEGTFWDEARAVAVAALVTLLAIRMFEVVVNKLRQRTIRRQERERQAQDVITVEVVIDDGNVDSAIIERVGERDMDITAARPYMQI
ncbi:MAG: hypothetical protein J6Y29_06775 [Clostridiales bacterium]|nr:hypothetical protein [Clostridiales bacterium]